MDAKDTKNEDSVQRRNNRVSQVLSSPMMREKDGAVSG